MSKLRRVAVLLNESAGTVVYRDGRSLSETIETAFAQYDVAATLHFLPGKALKQQARRALRQRKNNKVDALVVGGGDGTVATAAGVLAGTDFPLGILPLGTFNHFARDLGIPFALDRAIATIAGCHTKPVDLGEVNGETFINNSSIGIYPYLVVSRERLRMQRGMGKWRATALATWRTLRHFPLRRLHIHAGGLAEPYRSPCIFIGNNEYGLTGRELGKRERVDAGELCIYVAKKQTRLALFLLACRSRAGFIDRMHDLRAVKADEAEITSHTKRMLVALDGEVTMLQTPLRYRARPRALQIIVPEIS
jgi:diacylglycerol kinase family enzyme